MEWLEKLDSQEAEAWQELMIDYAYIPEDWEEARTQLFALLQKDQRSTNEEDARAYLSCCAESVGTTYPLPQLSETVIEFYSRFGMESSKEM
jgi:hypothetical protein